MRIVDAQVHIRGTGRLGTANHRQVEACTAGELPWLKGRDLEQVMGGAVTAWRDGKAGSR